jgi:hypothetical protein
LDPALERVNDSAEAGQQVLRQVGGLVPDLPVVSSPRPARSTRRPPARTPARTAGLVSCAGPGPARALPAAPGLSPCFRFCWSRWSRGMRHWHGWPLVPGLIRRRIPRSFRAGAITANQACIAVPSITRVATSNRTLAHLHRYARMNHQLADPVISPTGFLVVPREVSDGYR